MSLLTVRTVKELRAQVAEWRAQGLRVALVPTMGALHEGHLSLVRQGLERADRVVASIFVNPTQFGPGEDFDKYPRQEQADAELLFGSGGSALYLPTPTEMYAPGFCTTVTVAGLSSELCGITRPTHFAGVSTVVTKLLLQALPDVALFGEKDFQQLTIIRRTVRDLDIPVEIVGVPTLRESDGLAMSSRNRYLGPDERRIAPLLYKVLSDLGQSLLNGEKAEPLCAQAAKRLIAGGFASVDYVDVRDAETLAAAPEWTGRAIRILGAAKLGAARLIDNVGFSR